MGQMEGYLVFSQMPILPTPLIPDFYGIRPPDPGGQDPTREAAQSRRALPAYAM
jgi:hypothetical protein